MAKKHIQLGVLPGDYISRLSLPDLTLASIRAPPSRQLRMYVSYFPFFILGRARHTSYPHIATIQ